MNQKAMTKTNDFNTFIGGVKIEKSRNLSNPQTKDLKLKHSLNGVYCFCLRNGKLYES